MNIAQAAAAMAAGSALTIVGLCALGAWLIIDAHRGAADEAHADWVRVLPALSPTHPRVMR